MQPRLTYLTIERFRQILGLDWLSFYGVSIANCGDATEYSPCGVWVRDATQSQDNQLAWEYLLNSIVSAERDIQSLIGTPLGVDWVCEQRPWPFTSGNLRYTNQATYDLGAWFVEGGQRAETLILTANKGVELVYTVTNGFPEKATITATDAAFDGLDTCELVFKYQDYYIYPSTVTISGTTLTATFNSLQLLKPTLFDGYFTTYPVELCCAPGDMGCDSLDNFVDTVDVYRVYNDTTATQAQICTLADYNNGCGNCGDDPCTPQCQEACMIPVGDGGLVKIRAAQRDGEGGWEFLSTCGLSCPPSYVELNYKVNPCPEFSCSNSNCWNLCPEYETAIVALTAARLKKACPCECAASQITWYQRELGNDNTATTYSSQSVTFDILDSAPFGTLWGEIYAYQALRGKIQKNIGMVLI